MKQQGFTLLEVLVAVSISALIGVSAVQLLSSVGDTSRATQARAAEIAALQRFNQVVSRDISQFISRPIRDEYGDQQAALLLDSGDYPLEFTRAGWRNSPVSEDPRSTLQRVAFRAEELDSDVCEPALNRLAEAAGVAPEEYEGEGDCLVRYYWNVLDRSSDSEAAAQVVVDRISDLTFELLTQTYDENGAVSSQNVITAWPPVDAASENGRPVAIKWRFVLPDLGEIERLWLIAYDGSAW